MCSDCIPVTVSLAIKINGVNGFHSINVFISPVLGMAYTTGVAYIKNCKPKLIILLISLYNIPSGVKKSPIVVPNSTAAKMVKGNQNMEP